MPAPELPRLGREGQRLGSDGEPGRHTKDQLGDGLGPTVGGGDLTIDANPSPPSAGFPQLVEIDSNPIITGNTALDDRNGFSALTSSVWDLTVTGNTSLRDVTGLNSLGDTGNPPAASSFTIQGNMGLTDELAAALAATIEANDPGPADDLPTGAVSGNDP